MVILVSRGMGQTTGPPPPPPREYVHAGAIPSGTGHAPAVMSE